MVVVHESCNSLLSPPAIAFLPASDANVDVWCVIWLETPPSIEVLFDLRIVLTFPPPRKDLSEPDIKFCFPPTRTDSIVSKIVLDPPPAITLNWEELFIEPVPSMILLDTGRPVIKLPSPPTMADPNERLSIVLLVPPTMDENFIIVLSPMSVPTISTGPRIVFRKPPPIKLNEELIDMDPLEPPTIAF